MKKLDYYNDMEYMERYNRKSRILTVVLGLISFIVCFVIGFVITIMVMC